MREGWSISADGKRTLGPMPLPVLKAMVRDGGVPPNAWVLRPGAAEWVAARDLPELFPPRPSPPPLPPPLPPAEEEEVRAVLAAPASAPAAAAMSVVAVVAAPVAPAAAVRSPLAGTWAGVVVNDAGEQENEAFVFTLAGNPRHCYQGRDGRPVMVEITHVGQEIPYASPREAGRLTVQALEVTPHAVAWRALDKSVRSGGISTPGSHRTTREATSVTTWQARLQGAELAVQTVSEGSSVMTDHIRDFGGGGGLFHFGNASTIWKRGTLRRLSDDPDHVLKRFGGSAG